MPQVEVWRVNWSAVGQRVLMRRGAIGQVRRGRLAFVAEVRSLAHLLNQTVGRTFQHACDAELGDARCGVDLDDPAYKGDRLGRCADRRPQLHRLGARRLRRRLVHPRPADLDQRRQRRPDRRGREPRRRGPARRHLALLEAPVRPIAAGDDFVVRAGCDKRLETCRDRFANVVNFRGFPHIPGQDTVIRYPNRGDANSGDVL